MESLSLSCSKESGQGRKQQQQRWYHLGAGWLEVDLEWGEQSSWRRSESPEDTESPEENFWAGRSLCAQPPTQPVWAPHPPGPPQSSVSLWGPPPLWASLEAFVPPLEHILPGIRVCWIYFASSPDPTHLIMHFSRTGIVFDSPWTHPQNLAVPGAVGTYCMNRNNVCVLRVGRQRERVKPSSEPWEKKPKTNCSLHLVPCEIHQRNASLTPFPHPAPICLSVYQPMSRPWNFNREQRAGDSRVTLTGF